MGSLPLIGWQPKDNTGAIMSGAKAYFYQTGASTTPKNTYSDKALTSANANPVVADSSGRFGDIFLLKDEGYRVVLKTSADVTIYTKDSIFAESFAVDEEARRMAVVRSPIDNGAVGDGATNDYTALQAAITAAGIGVLDLEGKTYKCNSALSLPSGIWIRNGVIDFSSCNANQCITAIGTKGASNLLTSNSSEGASTAVLTTVSGLTAGDLLMLSNTAATPPMEVTRIYSIASLTATLAHHTDGAYTTANGSYAKKLTPLTDIVLEDVELIGNPSSSGTGTLVQFDTCERVRLINVYAHSVKAAAYMFDLLTCIDVEIDGCAIAAGATGGQGIGVNIGEACSGVVVEGCSFALLATGIQCGSAPNNGPVSRNVNIRASYFDGCTTGISLGQFTRYAKIDGNDIRSAVATNTGISASGRNISITNNDVTAFSTGTGTAVAIGHPTLWTTLYPNSLVVSGNRLNSTDGCVVFSSSTNTGGNIESITISGNSLYHDGDGGAGDAITINLSGCPQIGNLEIIGNAITETGASDGIDVGGTTQYVERCVIANNTQTGGTLRFIYVHGTVRQVTITGNVGETSTSATQPWIECADVIDLVISNNQMSGGGATSDGIYVNQATAIGSVSIAGNTLTRAASQNGSYLIRTSNADSVTISGNVISSDGSAILVGATAAMTVVAINGNVVDCFATGVGAVRVSASADLGSVSISGNTISTLNGTALTIIGTSAAAITGVVLSGNVCTMTAGSASAYTVFLSTSSTATITDVTIVGNRLDRGGDNDVNVSLSGAGGAITNVSAVGNALTDGTYGFGLTHVANFSRSNNTYSGITTGEVSGTLTRDGSKGFINLDITTLKIISGNDLQATTEGMLPDTNTAPLLQRVNGATDKSHRVVWAATSVIEVDFAPFAYPPDLDDTAAVTVNLLISKDTNTDSAAVVAVSYFEGIGDTNAGGNTSALSTASITKYAVSISASNIGAYPTMAKIGLTPGAHANDAIRLHAAWIEYTKNPAINAT